MFFFLLWHFLKEIMTMPCTFMQDFFCLSVLKHISICVIDLSGVFEKKNNGHFKIHNVFKIF